MTAGVAFTDDEAEPVMEEKEAVGLGMSVMEVVTRLGKLMGNMLGLLAIETNRD